MAEVAAPGIGSDVARHYNNLQVGGSFCDEEGASQSIHLQFL